MVDKVIASKKEIFHFYFHGMKNEGRASAGKI